MLPGMAERAGNKLRHLARVTRQVLTGARPLHELAPEGAFRSFVHFWTLVGRSFLRNRCPSRASALAYTTLLALVPMLAVGVSVVVSLLQKQGDKPVRELIDRLIGYLAPALDLQVKGGAGKDTVVAQITSFISNISSGALGLTGMIALIFAAIQMLRTIESAFNDIWGVTRGRSWIASIMRYWAIITLGPLFLAAGLVLSSGSQFTKTFAWFAQFPTLNAVVFSLAPFVLLSFGFTLFYMFIPNTKVEFRAALLGGMISGYAWQVNSLLNSLYASQVVSYSKIYGSLGLIPLFLLGIYFSWLCLLFGAQVAYAYQNRRAYLEEREAELINHKGRELIALRLAVFIALRFVRGEKPPSSMELSERLGVPNRLALQLVCLFVKAGLLVETSDPEPGYAPAKPLAQISCADILEVLRTASGLEMETCADEMRAVVCAELERIRQAEASVARSVTLDSLVRRSAVQPAVDQNK